MSAHPRLPPATVAAILAAYAQGNVSQAALAALHGITQRGVSKIVRREIWTGCGADGLPRPHPARRGTRCPVSAATERLIRRQYAAGQSSQRDLAVKYGVSRYNIWYILHFSADPLPIRPGHARRSMPSPQAQAAIRARYASGEVTMRALAKLYQVAHSVIWRIVHDPEAQP